MGVTGIEGVQGVGGRGQWGEGRGSVGVETVEVVVWPAVVVEAEVLIVEGLSTTLTAATHEHIRMLVRVTIAWHVRTNGNKSDTKALKKILKVYFSVGKGSTLAKVRV